MKLGLLVVLAVAVLVPSLSESRTVSRCELKKKLGESLVLPKKYQKYEDTILKVVICNVEWWTHLKTDRILLLGNPRKTTTTTRPVTTTPASTRPVATKPVTTKPTTTKSTTAKTTTTESMATNPVTTKPTTTKSTTAKTTTTESMATNPVTTKPTTTESTTAKTTTTESMATNPVTMEPTTTESATAKPTTTESVVTDPAATSLTSAGAMTTRSNQTTPVPGSNRRKREADATSDESDSKTTGGSLEEMLTEEQVKFDEEQLWQDDNKMEEEDNESNEGVEEHELEDGGKRKKRSLRRGRGRGRKVKSWSLGLYGIFGLTDSHFCDSGYRWSRNLCNTSCNAFTDEDISDDCDCAVKTHYWLPLFWRAPKWCRRVSVQRFFGDCD